MKNTRMKEITQLYEGAPLVANKWNKELTQIDKAFEGKLDYLTGVSTAMMLETAANHIDKVNQLYTMNESTQVADVGFSKTYAINLLSAVMPNLIAPEIVSLQPMMSSIGEIRFLELLYGSNKGQIKSGDTMMSPLVAGTSDTSYSSDEVVDEFIRPEGTDVETSLAWTPVIPGTISIVDEGKEFVDDGNGNLKGDGLTSGTVDYQTGAIKMTLAGAATNDHLQVTYKYDNFNVPVEAPEVNIKIRTAPIVAKSRKLKALYSLDSAYSMSTDYGMEINNELLSYTAAQIKHEIDGEIMNDLIMKAGAEGVTWDSTPRDGISLRDHNESLYSAILDAENNIFKATRLATGSFLVVGTKVASIIESLPRFTPSGAMNPTGPYLCGYLNGKPVYKNPYYNENTFLVGWKGTGLFDSGYIYAPYMPIMSTSLIVDANFQGQRGFATSYGKKMVNTNMYSKGIITRS